MCSVVFMWKQLRKKCSWIKSLTLVRRQLMAWRCKEPGRSSNGIDLVLLKYSGPWFNIKMSSYQDRKSHCGDKMVVRSSCLIHLGVRDKRRVSEIDLSQPRHETAFWWRHNEPVTSQLTDRIKWPNYPVELIGIYMHINAHNKESLTQRCRRSTNVQLCLIFFYISIWFES